MNSGGGYLATAFTVILSATSGLLAGSLEAVRAFLAGMTEAEATLVVGIIVGVLSQGSVWARWYLERRKAKP